MKKIYVGIGKVLSAMTVFHSETTPTPDSGYNAVIGPFKTKRGAQFMKQFGHGNPHCLCVADAEKLGKLYADQYDAKKGEFPAVLAVRTKAPEPVAAPEAPKRKRIRGGKKHNKPTVIRAPFIGLGTV